MIQLGSTFGLAFLSIFILVVLAMQGGSIASLWSLHAFVIVVGGSFAAVAVSFPAQNLFRMPRLIWEAFRPTKLELASIVATLIKLTDKIRRGGINAITQDLKHIEDPFLKKGFQYIAEGFDAKEIEDLLAADMMSIRGRHRNNMGVFEALGGYAPTLGIMGTVMSMVSILGNLDKPEALGAEIATAMVATLYGVASANIFFLPVATKLKKLSEEELRIRQVTIDIILSVQAGASPRLIRERLKAALPPETRKMIQNVKGKNRPGTLPMEEPSHYPEEG
ncbi:MAG TPA: MotA/TolQ/ExbB proton channel family protein [Chroococcales cyanobacterium]